MTAAAAVAYVAGAQAQQQQQQQHKPVVQRNASGQQTSQPQLHVNTNRQFRAETFTPQNGNRNFHAVQHPGSQHINPNARLGNPNVQHFNSNAQQFNPNAQHFNPNAQQFNSNAQKFTPNLVQPKGGMPLQGANALKYGPGKPAFNPVLLKPGPGGLQQIKPAFPAININNKFWPILKGPKFIWIGGYKKFFVPVGLLGVVLIGGSYWYPDGYVSMAGPACVGFTPDGCQLHWRMVDFEDGGAEPQCVQYCPQAGPPPAQIATLPPPAPFAENGACQVTIFSEPSFAGASAPTIDNQPNLSQAGWRNEISSVQVQAGIWEFFSEENFGGESMRLPAGPYPMLVPEWNKRIGSFMCVQPGAPGA